jgi:tartrate-resistant acid phosphatase type 5
MCFCYYVTFNSFIILDSFYISYDGDHEGVTSVNDPKWNRIWKGAYKGRLSDIVWYSVAGNHDW